MARAIDVKTHPDFTIDEIIEYTGWLVPSPMYKENMRRALDYFQQVVRPRSILREQDDAGPWNLRIKGTKIKLLNWMQGINFGEPVNPKRLINMGDPLIAYKDPRIRPGRVRGNWYTFPSTQQEEVGIHSTQTRPHKFKARVGFTCMQSKASDAFVGWVRDMPAEYRRGGAQQLFIWDAERLLEPA
jgi:hypothetical protein